MCAVPTNEVQHGQDTESFQRHATRRWSLRRLAREMESDADCKCEVWQKKCDAHEVTLENLTFGLTPRARVVVSYHRDPNRFFEVTIEEVGRYATRAADGRQLDKDLAQCAHAPDVAGSNRYARHVLDLGQVTEALDAVEPGLTNRAGRADAAKITSSHVVPWNVLGCG